jgi:hypothetical protein
MEARTAGEFFTERAVEPAPAVAAAPAPEAPPPAIPSAPVFDDELDVPAYLRQGKLLN